MLLDGHIQVCGSAVMQKKDALTETPQRSRPKFVAICGSLGHAIRQPTPHVVHSKIAKGLDCNVALPRELRFCRGERHGVTQAAADIAENLASACDGSARRGGGKRLRRR